VSRGQKAGSLLEQRRLTCPRINLLVVRPFVLVGIQDEGFGKKEVIQFQSAIPDVSEREKKEVFGKRLTVMR
jgi:hypothetical protein